MTQSLREQFTEALKVALRNHEVQAVATLRLILAALKDRDIALRSQSKGEDHLAEHEILAVLQTMIRQRQESIAAYEKAGRPAHAKQEQGEIEVIRRFLPKPMSSSQIEQAIDEILETKNLSGLKGMSCVMSELRKRYPGAVDFGFAGKHAKERLTQRTIPR